MGPLQDPQGKIGNSRRVGLNIIKKLDLGIDSRPRVKDFRTAVRSGRSRFWPPLLR